MADLRKFLFHSDYPMDKVVKIVSGAVTSVPAYDVKTVTISHGLPDRPYAIGTWSYSSSFNDVKDFATDSGNYTTSYVYPGTNSTSLQVTAFNQSGSTRTFYYRCILLAPHDATGDYSPVSTSNPTILNTDLNYFKIFKDGYTTGASVAHNLGYIPHVLAWYSSNGTVKPLVNPGFSPANNYPRVRVNETGLYFNMGEAERIYYRIYLDD